jgi:Arc/MetJ-type ribon-helix-helix transcriptional regulator
MTAMKKITVAMTEEMVADLEKERKERRLASVAETTRVVVGDYLAKKNRAQ